VIYCNWQAFAVYNQRRDWWAMEEVIVMKPAKRVTIRLSDPELLKLIILLERLGIRYYFKKSQHLNQSAI
jgi:hypothetical protein